MARRLPAGVSGLRHLASSAVLVITLLSAHFTFQILVALLALKTCSKQLQTNFSIFSIQKWKKCSKNRKTTFSRKYNNFKVVIRIG